MPLAVLESHFSTKITRFMKYQLSRLVLSVEGHRLSRDWSESFGFEENEDN